MFVCCSCRGVGRAARAFLFVNLVAPSSLQAKSSDSLGIVFSHMTSSYEYKEKNRNSPMHDTMISSMPVCTYVRTKCTGQVSRLAAHGRSSHGSGPPGPASNLVPRCWEIRTWASGIPSSQPQTPPPAGLFSAGKIFHSHGVEGKAGQGQASTSSCIVA